MQFQPTDVILPSGKQYQFHYDEYGNLRSVVMPGQSKHHLYSLTTFGVQRILYRPPESHSFYIQDFDSAGNLLQVSYPSGHRRLTAYYRKTGQPSHLFFDWTKVSYGYYGDGEVLHSVNVSNVFHSSVFCALVYGPNSSLVTNHEVAFEGGGPGGGPVAGLIDARFRYAYDRNLRVESTEAELGNRSLRSVARRYHPDTGRLQRVGAFTVEYGDHDQRVTTRDSNVEIVREFDRLGRLADVWFRFNVDHVVFNMDVKYDALGRLHHWRRKVRSSDVKAYEYAYDVDGNLVEVHENSQLTWKYEYDVNANIVRIQHYDSVRTIVVGADDRVESSGGQESYIYDQDGFLALRNHETFEYDSMGLLTRAFQSARYDVRYYYDGLRRLVGRRDVTAPNGRLVQFFYEDLGKRNQLTHAYDHVTRKISRFFYDDTGKLFAVQVESDLFYVGLDPNDSPVVVMNSVGSVVKQMAYDPLGSQIVDTAPDVLPFPFGFRCGVHDPVTRLVFLEDVVYDPQLGRRLVPDYGAFLARVNQLAWTPENANLYRFEFLKRPDDAITTYLKGPVTGMHSSVRFKVAGQWEQN